MFSPNNTNFYLKYYFFTVDLLFFECYNEITNKKERDRMKVKLLSLTLALLMLLGTMTFVISCDSNDSEGPDTKAPQTTESEAIESDTAKNETSLETKGESDTVTSTDSETPLETEDPTGASAEEPTAAPTEEPTSVPTEEPTAAPTEEPTSIPTEEPTAAPTEEPTSVPTEEPTSIPTEEPTAAPTEEPTSVPTEEPTTTPTETETETEIETGEPNITAEKTVSHTAGKTVYPGELITYSFVLKNSGTGKGTINITDTLPSNTEYVSGAYTVDGTQLSWSVTVKAGETKTVSYTVKVNNDLALCDGGTVTPGACKAGEFELQTHSLYIERTLNSVDQQYFDIAFRALKRSEYFTGFNLYRWMYGVAFTYAQAVSGAISIASDTPEGIMNAIADGTASEKVLDMVAPGLYGGTDITGAISGVKGSPAGAVTKDDLISGDGILRTKDGKTELFVYSNSGFCNLTEQCEDADLDEVLASLSTSEKYAVLRPSSNLIDFTPSDINEKPVELTEKQAAVVATAYYYLLRGECLQYDDTFMNKLSDSFSDFNESRWQTEFRTPESYTLDEWGYLNCAAFTNDVYWSTFGVALPGDMYYTGNIYTNSAKYGMRVYSFERSLTKTYTDEEKAAMEEAFMSNLEPGDLIVIRRKNGGGHVMVHIGNGRFIHATGDSMNTSALEGVKENREPTLRFHRVKDYFFNRDGALNSSNVFNDPTSARATVSIAIVRPFANETYASHPITDAAKARMAIVGLIIEKAASVDLGVSVNPGDEITYTFTLYNTRTDDITVDITDKIPSNTTYVSGCDDRDGDNLSWTVTIPAGKEITVSYTVRVADTALDTVIESKDAIVAGLSFTCADISVKKTLTESEQTSIINAFNQLKSQNTSLRGLALVNEIYKKALGVGNVFADVNFLTVTEGENGIYASSDLPIQSNYTYENFTRNEDGAYYKMLVPTLFGGRSIRSNGRNEWLRTRGVFVKNLMIGDVILGKRRDGITYIFMYTGEDKFINLSTLAYDTVDAQTTLDRLLGFDYFAVLRPSFVAAEAGDNDTTVDPETCTHTPETVFGEGGAYTIICSTCSTLIRDFEIPESVNWHSSLDAMNKHATISISKKLYDEENNLYYNSFTGNAAGHINVTGGTGSGSATTDEFEIGKYIVVKYRGSNTQLALYAGSSNSTKKMLGSYQARDAMPGDKWRVAVVSLENVSSFTTDEDGKSTVYVMLETYSSVSYNVDIAYVAIVDSLDEMKLLLDKGEDYYYYGTKFSSTPTLNGGTDAE